MVISLAFVPVRDLNAAFTALCQHLPQCFNLLLRWFEKYYLGRVVLGVRQRARFPPETWTCYERVRRGLNKTNNYAEASHRALKSEIEVAHPSIWTFIDKLQKIQGRNCLILN